MTDRPLGTRIHFRGDDLVTVDEPFEHTLAVLHDARMKGAWPRFTRGESAVVVNPAIVTVVYPEPEPTPW